MLNLRIIIEWKFQGSHNNVVTFAFASYYGIVIIFAFCNKGFGK